MDGIFQSINFVFMCFANILVASASEFEHLELLRCVFNLLVSNDLVISKFKYLIGIAELEYLSRMVTSEGIRPFTSRIDAIY